MDNGSPPVAAIDLGSNGFRLLIGRASTSVDHRPLTLTRRRASVSLARSLNDSMELAPQTMVAALESLREFRRVMSELTVCRCRCCGTAVLRQAANRMIFLEAAESMLETKIEVLTPKKEAELGCQGVLAALAEASPNPCLIVDVGGGSTELSYIDKFWSPNASTSLPFGAATLAAKGLAEKISLLNRLRIAIGEIVPHGLPDPAPTLVATGGTASILAALAQSLDHYAPDLIQGFHLIGSEIPGLAARLRGQLTTGQNLPKISRGREDNLSFGLEIYQEILATIGGEGMIISDAGLLEGILLSLLETA